MAARAMQSAMNPSSPSTKKTIEMRERRMTTLSPTSTTFSIIDGLTIYYQLGISRISSVD